MELQTLHITASQVLDFMIVSSSLQNLCMRNRAEDVASLITLIRRSPTALQVTALTLYDRCRPRQPIDRVKRTRDLFEALPFLTSLTLRLDLGNLTHYLVLLTHTAMTTKLLPSLSHLTLGVKQFSNTPGNITTLDWTQTYNRVHALVKSRCGSSGPLSNFQFSVALLTQLDHFAPPKDFMDDLVASGVAICVFVGAIERLWYSAGDDSDGSY
jgi:hypothetical protein